MESTTRVQEHGPREYNVESARQLLAEAAADVDAIAPRRDGKSLSASPRTNQSETVCCQPSCCRSAAAEGKE